jgi:LysR family transcriptional regulator, benzoate and cis,cis-muconate-responsive activator of ben and cat genes
VLSRVATLLLHPDCRPHHPSVDSRSIGPPELRQIDCFLAVAKDLHFGKAAKRLSLAQSSVSEAIRSLEQEVGGPLLVQTSRRVQLTSLGEKFRLGVEPAALVLHATLDDCRKTVLGQPNRLRIGFLGGGLYELTLPFVRHLRSKFHIDVEWVELSLLDQFEAIAVGKVDAAFCRLPLSHDGLVQCTVLLEEKKKLVVPADHRLSNRDWINPEELALETIPTLPDNHHLGAWAAIHFPDHTPSGRPIARGPVVTTIRESLAAVESGEAVVIVGARAELYYSNPRVLRSIVLSWRSAAGTGSRDYHFAGQRVTHAVRAEYAGKIALARFLDELAKKEEPLAPPI